MARYRGPKHKLSRRVGYCLWGTAKSPANRRPFPPGQHGNKAGRKKESNYGRQLLEKQKLRHIYGMLERQFRLTFKRASAMRGNTADNFLALLESRLDAFVYRTGFAPTIWAARQLVTHAHFLVNGKKVNVPSYQLKPGDVVTLKEKSRKNPIINASLANIGAVPAYLHVSPEAFQAKLVQNPDARDIPVKVEIALIVEFYSR
jgi:small subunit ribosomal protein S4